MKAKSIAIKNPAYRHGEILVEAVKLAIADIERWINRRQINFTSKQRLHIRTYFAELRRNAQVADGWLTGRFESTISFQECCELLGQNHEQCLDGLYGRWAAEQIESLRSATPQTDYDDLDAICPGMGKTLIPIDDIDESTELADEDEESPEDVHDEPFTLTTEGAADAGSQPTTKTRNLDRRRRLRERPDQRMFAWDGPVDDQDPADPDFARQGGEKYCPDRN